MKKRVKCTKCGMIFDINDTNKLFIELDKWIERQYKPPTFKEIVDYEYKTQLMREEARQYCPTILFVP